MDSTISSLPINFALLNQTINRYISIVLLFFGIIGNILNILVFTRKIFRNNICVTYFLASTIFDFLALVVGLIPRSLNGFNIDPSQNSAILCKLKFFITYFAGYTAAWFIGFACVERYLTSSTDVNTRRLITMKRARLSMIFVILFGFLAFGEQFYCIDINQNLFGASQSCYQLRLNIQCQIADSLMQFLFEILAPTLMMIVFGSLTLRNVRRKHRRINIIQTANRPPSVATSSNGVPILIPQQPINNTIGQNKQPLPKEVSRVAQKREAQLILILFIQIIFILTVNLPSFRERVHMNKATIVTTFKEFIIHQRLKFSLFLVPLYLYGLIIADDTIFSKSFLLEFIIIHLFFYGGVNALNDYYDRDEEGPIGGLENPPPIHGDSLFYLAWLWKLIGLFLSIKCLSLNFVIVYFIAMLLSVCYSHPSIRLKSSPLGSLVLVGSLQGFGTFCFGAKNTESSLKFYTGSFVAILIAIGFYPLTQVYQIEQDRRQGDTTLAMYLGVKGTFQFSCMCLLISGIVNSLLIGYYYHSWESVIIFFGSLLLIYFIKLWENKFERQTVLENFQSLHRLMGIYSVGIYAFCLAHLLNIL